MTSLSRTPAAGPGTAPKEPRERILDAFEERARKVGIRGVVMSELARELGISKKTLYQHFASKEALVRAMIDDMSGRLHERANELEAMADSPGDLMRLWADEVLESEESYTPVFWQDLETEYPEAHAAMTRQLDEARERAKAQLTLHLRPDVTPEVALATYEAILSKATDPELCERLKMTRQESVMAALEIWARGALRTHSAVQTPTRLLQAVEPNEALLGS